MDDKITLLSKWNRDEVLKSIEKWIKIWRINVLAENRYITLFDCLKIDLFKWCDHHRVQCINFSLILSQSTSCKIILKWIVKKIWKLKWALKYSPVFASVWIYCNQIKPQINDVILELNFWTHIHPILAKWVNIVVC